MEPAESVPIGCVRPHKLKSGVFVRCQSRVRSLCPSCAELYRGDWAAIARSGVFDADVSRYRFYLLTLTAPSFGRVHRVPRSPGARLKRCGCGATHDVRDAGLRGVPLDMDSYDYAGQVAWNRDAGVLWDRTRRRFRDWWPSVELFLVREWQDRGVLHLHALVRIDRGGAPEAAVLREVARTVQAVSPVDGACVGWGPQADAKRFRADGDGAKTIWYLSKALNYVMKDTALAAMSGRGSNFAWEHLTRLGQAARAIRCSRDCDPDECASRVHDRYGSRSHVVSASRRTRHRSGWSFTGMTRRSQRESRAAWVAARAAAAGAAEPATAPERQDGADAARSDVLRRIDVARSAVLP
ncbi:replication initiator [Naasia sp. SYSU D00057]|uniref:replication initiator n=1 Tax=Naasia sp. SYSU D00057 TaxID=2817380 RepID=UPI001B3026FD|nr:replication initiator [Naasia sp. SYSU D00057]